jgi:anaerobic magnesium-protoporphyrin IX monomethyl ester cyclase
MTEEIDCLVIGHHQMDFPAYVRGITRMGEDSGAFADVKHSFYVEDGEIVSCRDHCNAHHLEPGEPALGHDDIFSATLAYLCTFLHRNGLTYDYVNSFREGRDALVRKLESRRVRAVAVTTTYYVVADPIVEVIATVRRHSPETKIILGGPFINTQFKIHDRESFLFMLERLGADFYVVSSQGERALVEIVRAIRARSPLAAVENCIYRVGDHYVVNPSSDESNDLGENLVDWSLFAGDVGGRGRKMVMVRTARSCAFACAFCSFPAHAGPFRYVDPRRVSYELDALEALGDVRSVTFIDDTFNIPVARFHAFLDMLEERRYRFGWNCNLRLQHVDEDAIARMRECGCEGVFLGIESGSQTILAHMNKRSRVEAYRRGIELLRRHGIMSYASFVVGFPGEAEGTIRETMDFIDAAQPDFFRAQLWYYDTMTPIHRDARRYGLVNSQFEWTHATMSAREAARWVDHLHREVQGSVWLPQNDFDYPSLFDLLSRGWSVDRVKDMLRGFNARVRRGFEPQQPAELDAPLLAQASLRF